eukprot:scaffold14087_cov97-Skeletonema_dohrnii-CCMP3373.AAC.3
MSLPLIYRRRGFFCDRGRVSFFCSCRWNKSCQKKSCQNLSSFAGESKFCGRVQKLRERFYEKHSVSNWRDFSFLDLIYDLWPPFASFVSMSMHEPSQEHLIRAYLWYDRYCSVCSRNKGWWRKGNHTRQHSLELDENEDI